MLAKIAEGKMKKFYQERCLLEQPFIKDSDVSIGEVLKGHIAKFGENITIRRFSRYRVGEEIDNQPPEKPEES